MGYIKELRVAGAAGEVSRTPRSHRRVGIPTHKSDHLNSLQHSAGLLYGHDLHHIDHIAPLCSFLKIPLFVTEDIPTALYPDLRVEKLDMLSCASAILEKCDVLFTCLPKQILDPLFFFDEMKLRKKLLCCWVPHGNSDKENLSALTEEKLLLVYGRQMIDRLPSKGANQIMMGNLRAHFFKMHEAFYQKQLLPELQFKKKQKTLFYAPTWDETSVNKVLPYLLKHLPTIYNLFVKVHPNTLAKGLFLELQNQPNIRILTHIPTIYPILQVSDVYIGDHSSIAYDFLYFNRPLFFLTHKKTPIHFAGQRVEVETLFEALESEDHFQEARKELYRYAFYDVDYHVLGETIADYCETKIHGL